MKHITKIMLALFMLTAGTMLQAKVLPGWIPTQGRSLTQKYPDIITETDNVTILKGLASGNWVYFKPTAPIQAVKGNSIEITLKISSCKGKIFVGFFEYSQGFFKGGIGAQLKPLKEISAPEEVKLSIPVKGDKTTIVRPQITLASGSKLTLTSLTCKVTGKPAPKYKAEAKADHADFVYKCGETAKFTLSATKDGQEIKEGKVVISFRKNGLLAGYKSFDLNKDPASFEMTMDKPGFAVASMMLYENGTPVIRSLQIGAAAFEPEKIRAGKEAPADLLDYWKNEYAKLNKEVPPEFKLMKSGATAAHLRYKLTCRNFGDTPTYASITIPKGKGPFPMIFTVPPAGNYGYGFFSTPKTIHVTITVFDRLFPTNDDYMKFNRPVWYFHQGAQKRETYYYYKAILGMMRVMDYAMTQIKEWDGKHLMAIGRSQGGGSAIIMAALNPKIQALAADVPALCDHNARLNGRRPGWPQILDQKTTAKSFATDAEYFDAANFASFVKCPAVLSVGFYDTMCEPSSVYSAYNNLKGPKKVIHCPRYGHGWGKRDTAFDNEVIKIRSETFMK